MSHVKKIKRVSFDTAGKGYRVRVDGQTEIDQTITPGEVFGVLDMRGHTGKVMLWVDGLPRGEVDIAAEAALHRQRTLLRRRRRGYNAARGPIFGG